MRDKPIPLETGLSGLLWNLDGTKSPSREFEETEIGGKPSAAPSKRSGDALQLEGELDSQAKRLRWVEDVYPGPKTAAYIKALDEAGIKHKVATMEVVDFDARLEFDKTLGQFVVDGEITAALDQLVPLAIEYEHGATRPTNLDAISRHTSRQALTFKLARAVRKTTCELIDLCDEETSAFYSEELHGKSDEKLLGPNATERVKRLLGGNKGKKNGPEAGGSELAR